MKQKQTLLTAALVLLLSACSTTKTVTPAPEPPAAEETAPVVSLPIVAPKMEEIRYQIDKLELIVEDDLWTLPKYRELLFIR